MSAILRFPHARLMIHNLLADERISGAQAIVRTAREFGVIDEADRLQSDEHGVATSNATEKCECCNAAFQVLQLHFKASENELGSNLASTAYSSMISALNKYREQIEASEKRTATECGDKCSKIAAVIFDLTLQEIHRYS